VPRDRARRVGGPARSRRKRPKPSFQARERPLKGRGWVHLDLYTNNRDGEVSG